MLLPLIYFNILSHNFYFFRQDQTLTMDDDDMRTGKSPEENEDHDDHDNDDDRIKHRLFSSGVRWRRLPWPGPSLSISSLTQIFIIFSTLIRPSLEGM